MNKYFTPPANFNLNNLSGFLTLGLGLVVTSGGFLVAFSIVYIIYKVIMLALGKGKTPIPKMLTIFIISLVVGLLLFGGGWLNYISLTHKSLIEPMQDILPQ